MPTADELRAALAVAELEEQLDAEKARLTAEHDQARAAIIDQIAGTTDPAQVEALLAQLPRRPDAVDTDLKERVREARRVYREMREQRDPEPGEARPDAIRATATVNEGN